MNHVFISYSRKDEAAVTRITSALKEKGYPIWQDISGPASGIPFSTKWFDIIEEAVYSASGAVIFDSPNWRQSDPCQQEYRLMQKTGVSEHLTVISVADIDEHFEEILDDTEDFIQRIQNDRGNDYRALVFSAAYAMKNGADPHQLVETHSGIRSGFQYLMLIIRMFAEREDLKDYDPDFYPYLDRYLKFALRSSLSRVFSLVFGILLIAAIAVYAIPARNVLHQGGFKTRSAINDDAAVMNMKKLRYKDLITAVTEFNQMNAFSVIYDTLPSVVANTVQLLHTDMPVMVKLNDSEELLTEKSSGLSDRFLLSFSEQTGAFYISDLLNDTSRTVSTPSKVTSYVWNHNGTYLCYACGRDVFIMSPYTYTMPMRFSESIYPVSDIGFYMIEGKEQIVCISGTLALVYDIPFAERIIAREDIRQGKLLNTEGTAVYISDNRIWLNQNNKETQLDIGLSEQAVLHELAVYQNSYLAAAYVLSGESHLLIYDLSRGVPLNDLTMDEDISQIVFCEDGSRVFAVCSDNHLHVIDTEGTEVNDIETDERILSICPYRNGIAVQLETYLAFYDRDLKMKKKNSIQTETYSSLNDMAASADDHLYMAENAAGKHIAVVHTDVSGKKQETVYYDTEQNYAETVSVSVTDDAQYVLFGYDDGTIRIFADNGRYMLYEDRPLCESAVDQIFNPQTNELIILGASGTVYHLSIEMPELNIEYVGTKIESLQAISDMLTEKCNRYYDGIID